MRWNERVYIKDLKNKIEETHTLQGWVHFTRKSKIRFIGLRDGTGIIQGVLSKDEVDEETFALFSQLKQETCIELSGIVKENQRSHFGVELLIKGIKILGASHDYPITPKEHGVDFLLERRHLWLRSKKQIAIFKVRDEITRAIRDFLSQGGFTQMDSPILTGVVGEDPKGLFSTEYFHLGKAYLAQTGQLYLESSIFSHGKVYCFGPTFRSEKSKTRRHLTEFWMMEAEMAFFDNNDNMDVQEDMIKFVLERVLANCQWQFEQLGRDTALLKRCLKPFTRIDYPDAIKILQEKGSTIQYGDDLGATDEAILVEDAETPIFVYDYPKDVKAFYMKEHPTDPDRVKCADMLAPEGYGEVIGGSQREDDFDKLKQKIEDENLPIDKYDWYLDLRKYGTVTHSGFGIGIERLVAWVCGIPHVREAIPFPRLMERITP